MNSATLSPEQLEDASRLKEAFEASKITQKSFADLCGWKTQAVVSHYINGKIPLNPRALAMFCKFLRIKGFDISPDICSEVAETATLLGIFPSSSGMDDPLIAQAVHALRQMSPQQRQLAVNLIQTVKAQ